MGVGAGTIGGKSSAATSSTASAAAAAAASILQLFASDTQPLQTSFLSVDLQFT